MNEASMSLAEKLAKLADAQGALARQVQAMLIREAAHTGATSAVLSALVASHPDPESLRQEIATFSSLSMLSLSSTGSRDPLLRDELKKQFDALLSAMIEPLQKRD